MALGLVVTSEILGCQVRSRTTTLVAVEAKRLLMALFAIITGFACQSAVTSDKIGVVVKSYTFTFMAGVALPELHLGVFGV